MRQLLIRLTATLGAILIGIFGITQANYIHALPSVPATVTAKGRLNNEENFIQYQFSAEGKTWTGIHVVQGVGADAEIEALRDDSGGLVAYYDPQNPDLNTLYLPNS